MEDEKKPFDENTLIGGYGHLPDELVADITILVKAVAQDLEIPAGETPLFWALVGLVNQMTKPKS